MYWKLPRAPPCSRCCRPFRLLATTTGYAKQHKQFGRTIGRNNGRSELLAVGSSQERLKHKVEEVEILHARTLKGRFALLFEARVQGTMKPCFGITL